jgi:hypothetical protein
MLKSLSLMLAFVLAAGSAKASSDDAWVEFAKEVEGKCLSATKGTIHAAKAVVDPFGSKKFGLAIVSGNAKGGKARISQICVIDKQTRAVELSGEFGEDKLRVSIGK